MLRLRSYLLNLVKSMTISVMSAMTAKMPSIPCHRIVSAACKAVISVPPYFKSCGTRFRIMPPARTLAICPATFAPTACISRWFCGSASSPIF